MKTTPTSLMIEIIVDFFAKSLVINPISDQIFKNFNAQAVDWLKKAWFNENSQPIGGLAMLVSNPSSSGCRKMAIALLEIAIEEDPGLMPNLQATYKAVLSKIKKQLKSAKITDEGLLQYQDEVLNLEQIKAKAKHLKDKQEYENAVRSLFNAAKNYKKSLELYSLLGSMAIKEVNSHLTRIIDLLEFGLTIKVASNQRNNNMIVGIHNELAKLYQKRNFLQVVVVNDSKKKKPVDLDQAIKHLRLAININPTDYSFSILSNTYLLKGDYYNAYTCLGEGIKLVKEQKKALYLSKIREELTEQLDHINMVREIEGYLAKADLKTAFSRLHENLREKYEHIRQDILEIEAHWSHVDQNFNRNHYSNEEYGRELSKINTRVLNILNRLRD